MRELRRPINSDRGVCDLLCDDDDDDGDDDDGDDGDDDDDDDAVLPFRLAAAALALSFALSISEVFFDFCSASALFFNSLVASI